MKKLTQVAKAEAMRLAMRIDLGELDNQFILSCIKKDKNTWIPILEFWAQASLMTQSVLERLAVEHCYLKS